MGKVKSRPGQDFQPVTGEGYGRLKERERKRQKWDPEYITREEAEKIPQEAIDARPELAGQIQRSSEEWPENKLAASEVFKGVPADGGDCAERKISTEQLFGGDVKGALEQD